MDRNTVRGTITQFEINDDNVSPAHCYAMPIIPGARHAIEVFSEVLHHRQGVGLFDAALSVKVAEPSSGGLQLRSYYGTLGTDGFNRDGYEGIDPAMVDVIGPVPPSPSATAPTPL